MKINLKASVFIICYVLTVNWLQADNRGLWVEFELGREITSAFGIQYSAGGNCLIWLDSDSGQVLTYEKYTHQWHEFEEPILPEAGKQVASAGEDVALVWDDTTALAFNARTQSFHKLHYEGFLTDELYGHGCYSSTAWFLTSEKFYVFDAHDDAWKSFDYTKPDGDTDYSLWRCRDKSSYLFLELRSSIDYNHHTLLTYSRITRTFNELVVEQDLLHTIMDMGFVFYYDDYSGDEHDYFGGYSANTAEFTVHKPNLLVEEFTTNYPENLSGQTVFSFFYKTEVEHPEYKGHFYAYNTVSGNLDSTVFNYMYTGDGLRIIMKINGADFSVISTYQKGGDETINYLIYSGTAGAFYTLSTDLIYDYDYAQITAGSGVLTQNDEQVFLGLDIETQTLETAAMPAPPESYHHLMHPFASHDWAVNCCDVHMKDSVRVFSYNSRTGMHHTFNSNSTGSFTQLNNENIFAYIPYIDSGRPFVHMYTPGTDTWHQIPVSGNVSWTYNRDFITLFMEGENDVILYDGVDGSSHSLPYGHADYSYTYRHINDNFLILYTDQGGSEAYSTFTRSTSSHPESGNWSGQVAVSVCSNSEGALAYNALYNCFTSLKIDPERHGQYKGYAVGDSIAAMFYSEGYLFVYDPHADSTSVGISRDPVMPGPAEFRLDQNFPNPFNPLTVIRYHLSKNCRAELVVYNVLGQKIRTLFKGQQKAGSYSVQFNAADLPSGVYIYRLSTDTGSRLIRKMLVVK